jgi:homoserine kinase type II
MHIAPASLPPAALLASVRDRYGIGDAHAVTPLSGGEYKTMWRLDTARGPLVLGVRHPSTRLESMQYEHDLLRFMHSRIPQVPAPLVANDDTSYFTFNNRVITLFEFIEGEASDSINEAIRCNAAGMLACLHQAALEYPNRTARPGLPPLRELDWERNTAWSKWHWPRVARLLKLLADEPGTERFLRGGRATREIVARKSQIEAERRYFRDWTQNLAAANRNLSFAPIHGDYYRQNLLTQGDQISGIIDWDECRADWLCFELAFALWEFCGQEAFDQQQGVVFLHAYREAGGPVPHSEFDLIVPFMRCIRIMEVLSALDGIFEGGPWGPAEAEYHLNNLISLEKLRNLEVAPY